MPAAAPAARSRLTERHVLALGLAASALFVASAAVSAAIAVARGGSPWAAVHLALAGAATVAIGAFMPHFAITLSGTRPAPARQRLATLALLAGGGAGVVLGLTVLASWVAGLATIAILAGLALVAAQTFAHLRDSLARRHHVVALTYGVALAELAVAVALGGLAAIGAPVVLGAWASLRPAHAWLALFGAVSLTIFATLVYLAPTVMGARIRPSAWLAIGAGGMLAGPIAAAAGFAVDARPAVVAGTVITAAGAIGQIGYVLDTRRRRGRFTSEHAWRRVVVGHLLAGTGWFAAAALAALVGVVSGGPIVGWSLGSLAVPMVAGWMLQELVGSWTHLVPSVTPGTPDDHAAQRRILSVASRSRLVAWNLGVGLAWAGVASGSTPLALAGFLALGASVAVSVGSVTRALTAGRY